MLRSTGISGLAGGKWGAKSETVGGQSLSRVKRVHTIHIHLASARRIDLATVFAVKGAIEQVEGESESSSEKKWHRSATNYGVLLHPHPWILFLFLADRTPHSTLKANS